MQIRVLGPVAVIGTDGRPLAVGSKRRRELLGRLVAARGRVVPLEVLIDDLWEDPPAGAVGAVRTFVSELRGALGADVIATVGRGYALRVAEVDAWRFEEDVRSGSPSSVSWGEPYADLDPSPWVLQERARLSELRSQAVELRARVELDQGRGASLVAELAEFAGTHPWREKAQVLLAHALYQDGRQVEALDVLREARGRLVDRFGLDAVPDLDRAEADILRHAVTRTGGSYTRLRSASVVAGVAALTGELGLAQAQRFAAVAEAERLGDPLLTARVLSAYDVPANWTISDDEPRARALVETARRTVRLLPDGAVALRARVLATIAVEHRGSRDRWAFDAAAEADRLARELGDPAVLVVALNARFMQSFQQPGRSRERAVIAAELIEVAAKHDLPAYEILGHLVAIQAHAAVGAFEAAEPHAVAAEQLAKIHETPLVHVFTRAFRVMRAPDEASYRELADELTGMPGVATGFLPLALLSLRLRHGLPAPADPELDWGPYRPWAQPLLHLAGGDVASARRAAANLPTPRADHFYEVLWAITTHIATQLDDRSLASRAREALEPARGEIAGGNTAMMTFGPVDDLLR